MKFVRLPAELGRTAAYNFGPKPPVRDVPYVPTPQHVVATMLKEKKEPYPLEVIATWPHPKGKKAHETIVNFSEAIKPSDVHKALESLGLTAGKPLDLPSRP